MTTDTQREARISSARVLAGSVVLMSLLGLVATAVGFVAGGSRGGLGALAGALVVVVVLTAGAMVVEVVAGVMPKASLMVALLTYALQVVALGALLALARTSASLSEVVDLGWAGAAAIACALGWTVAQVRLATRVRIPVYDLDLTGSSTATRGTTQGAAEGSAR